MTKQDIQLGFFEPTIIKRKPTRKAYSYANSKKVGSYLHLGAGLQSSTLVEMMVEGDIPPVDAVIFCDTKDEPGWVYAQVDYLDNRLEHSGIPLIRIARSEGGIVHDLKFSGAGRFASMPLWILNKNGSISILRRQCTKEYKIEPANQLILSRLMDQGLARQLEDKNGRKRIIVERGVYIDSLFGISLDELERAGSRGRPWQKAEYPLINMRMTRLACEKYLIKKGLRVPLKSSCRVCPFHDNAFWRMIRDLYPEDWSHCVEFDHWLRSDERRSTRQMIGLSGQSFLHRSCVPLDEADLGSNDSATIICGQYCMN